MSTVTVKVPDIGDFDAVEIIEVLVAEGDTVAVEDGLVSLESDKATMDVPSTAAGKISKLLVQMGDKVAEGDAVAEIEVAASDAAPAEDAPAEETPADDGPGAEAEAPAPAPAAPPASAQTSSEVDITVPDIGDFDAVEIIEILVAEGDEVELEQGLITLEDILEELVGDIEDEYDDEEEMYVTQQDGSFIVDGRIGIIEIEQQLGILIPQEGDYDTLGGFIFHCAGTIPKRGYVIHKEEFELEIIRSDERRVEKVRIKPVAASEDD